MTSPKESPVRLLALRVAALSVPPRRERKCSAFSKEKDMTDDQATGQSRGVSRRDFLRASGMAAVGVALAPQLIAAQETRVTNASGVKSMPTPRRTPKGSISHRQFWLDEAGPAGARSVHHVY